MGARRFPSTRAALAALALTLSALPLVAEPGPPPLTNTPQQPPALPDPLPPGLPAQLYVAQNGQPVGPLGPAEIAEMARQGKITAETLVWMPGMAAWTPAGQVPGMAPVLALAPAPAFDAYAYVAGSWRLAEPMVSTQVIDYVGAVQIETMMTLTYYPDHTLKGEGVATGMMPSGSASSYFSLSGTYAITGVTGGLPGARFTIEPKVTITYQQPPASPDPTGLKPPQSIPPQQSDQPATVLAVDANTMEDILSGSRMIRVQ